MPKYECNEKGDEMSDNDDNPMRYPYFMRFELAMPHEAAMDCSTPGQPADDSVAYWETRIQRPAEITPEALRAELKEYGAWDAEELSDDNANWRRLIWLAACQIRDELREEARRA